MGDNYELGIYIKKTELIKEQLNKLNHIIGSEFGYFCSGNKNETFPSNDSNKFSKSILNIFYTSWRMEDFSKFNLRSVMNILKRNQYVVTCVYFLAIFTCVYFSTLFLYTKCFRRILKIFACRICKKEDEGEVRKESGMEYGVGNGIGNGVGNGIGNGIGNGVGNGIGNGVENGTGNGVENGIGNGVENGVENRIGNGVGNGVENGIENGVENGIGNGVGNGIGNEALNEERHEGRYEHGREKPRDEKKDGIKNLKKRMSSIISYSFLCILLCFLVFLGSWFIYRFLKTKNGIHMNICSVSKSIENVLVDRCSNNAKVDEVCYSVETILNEVVIIVEKYQNVKDQIRQDIHLDEENSIPFFSDYIKFFNNIKRLRTNIHNNNKALEEGYYHSYPVLMRIKEVLDSIITQGDGYLQNTQMTIKHGKNVIKAAITNVDMSIEQSLKENIDKITTKFELVNKSVYDITRKYKIKDNIRKYTLTLLIAKFILLLPPVLILIGLFLFIFYLIKGNISNSNHFFLDLFGVFSAYFGFLTIVTLLMGTVILSVSIIGGTTCVISERVLKNELNFEVFTDTLLEYCLKNKKSSIIEENLATNILNKINSFDINEIENRIMEYGTFFTRIKQTFNKNTSSFLDYLWVIVVKKDNNQYLDNIKLISLKKSLLVTGVTRDNVRFGVWSLWGINEYISHLNRYFFNDNYALCFEDTTCEKNINKYNICYKSSINDLKYINLRNKLNNDVLKNDLDNVVNIFIKKAKILKEKIFDLSDLDNTVTKKIGWDEYTPKDKDKAQSSSIIRKYLVNSVDSINFADILNIFAKIKNGFNSLKELIITTVESLIKNMSCNRVVNELNRIRQNYCDQVVLNATLLSISLIAFSTISFLLWYFFLFCWLYYQLKAI
ncbi:conserved Plasmodium protein, unknown function [Plasmodium malariae]|uniref:Uncharacterized protein n=1 Tax=Plasmodium malariae TaxID=5858 RepID=A0A1D3JKS1_PLAMA|nr:conserved Plasmodium protein, unknown function [Plasmodium malariae]SBT87149.1 conserved Plasmodium protein, unknown function [Plasmodium malariae]